MKKILWIPLVIIACISMSACGAGKSFEPTLTPSKTIESTFAPSNTPTETSTFTPTTTNTPVLFRITFQAFHDFNGNGKHDTDEPNLAGIETKIISQECTTNESGKCEISGIIEGIYNLSITDKRDVPLWEKMRYLLPSVSEVRIISQGLAIDIHENKLVYIPLGQGFLTWPSDSKNLGEIGTYMDRLLGPGCVNWNKDIYHCGDDHNWGMDIAYPPGTTLVAAAPMFVDQYTDRGVEGVGLGISIHITEKTIYDEKIVYGFDYSHMTKIILNPQQLAGTEIVKRGDVVGLSGTYGSYPHLHFGFYAFKRQADGQAIPLRGQPFITIDPFAKGDEGGYWIIRNQPYPPY